MLVAPGNGQQPGQFLGVCGLVVGMPTLDDPHHARHQDAEMQKKGLPMTEQFRDSRRVIVSKP
jgi:hypothetical protein